MENLAERIERICELLRQGLRELEEKEKRKKKYLVEGNWGHR